MVDRSIPGSSSFIGTLARHPNAANLIMVLMVLFGIYAIGKINTQFFPTVEQNAVNITVGWSGASAEDVQSNILQIVEPEIRFLENVDKMSSTAREGRASITLEFAAGTDMQTAVGDVDSAVKAIGNLPEDSDTPRVAIRSWYDGVATLSISGDVPESTLRIYAKKIRDDLIDRGIDRVDFTGMRSRELLVEIPERELRRVGLTVSDVSNKIRDNSRNLPSGSTEGVVSKQLRSQSDFKTPSEISELEISSFASGEKVMLKDIADIKFDYDPDAGQGLIRGLPAIQIAISRAPNADTLETAQILNDYLEILSESLPPGITLQKYNVRADAVRGRINLLLKNGATGLVLVVLTLFIFLNARIAFWVAAGIPVALLATVGFMMTFGETINMITLFAMIMMLGIIVDDAIVVGEHTATRFSQGDGPYEAAENGAGWMITPVSAAMLTTVASFAPILLITGTIGQIMGALPIVVVAVLVASLIECFLILPGHLAHTLQPDRNRGWSYWRHLFFSLVIGMLILSLINQSVGLGEYQIGESDTGNFIERTWTYLFDQLSTFIALVSQYKTDLNPSVFISALVVGTLIAGAIIEALLWVFSRSTSRRTPTSGDTKSGFERENIFRRMFDATFRWFRDGPFAWVVGVSYRWRYVTVAIAAACMMVLAYGLYAGGKVQFVFFASPESENIRARLVFNAGLPETRIKEIVRLHEDTLLQVEEELGQGEKLIDAFFVTLGSAGRNTGDNLAEMRIQLTSSEVRTVRSPDIVRAWRSKLPKVPGLRRSSISQTRGGPPGRDVELQLAGPDVAVLKKAADEVVELVSQLPSATGASDNLPYGKPELVMKLTPRGAALGFSIEDVSAQVRSAFSGSVPRKFAFGDEEISIRVKRTSRDLGTAALRNFELKSRNGDFVPLSEVVALLEQQGFAAIRREDGKTLVSITADLDTDVFTTEQAEIALVEDGLPDIATKYGIEYKFAGRSKERNEAFSELLLGVMMALFVIYIILAWVFSSYWRPFAVMLIIPFGVVGAIFGHWMMEFKLSILSFISILGLAGILVNDSIILVSRLDERLSEGQSLFEAATGASRDRLRAVLLTSLTTIGGLIPLMFEKSVQAQFILPMAVTIIFGLGLATLLVLFLVPAFVAIGADIRWLIGTIFNNRQSVSPAE